MATYVSRGEQVNTVGNATISPTSLDHTEFLQILGVAGTRNIVLSIVGMADGALLRVKMDLPATSDIVLNFFNADLTGDQLSTITTGYTLNAMFTYCYKASTGTWQPINYANETI